MKRALFLSAIVVICLTTFVRSQQLSPTPLLYSNKTISEMERIRDASLASDFAYRQVGHLAMNIGPRLSGSPQAAKALEYVADEMRKLGLEVRLQKVMVPHWVRGEERGEIVEFPGMAAGTNPE